MPTAEYMREYRQRPGVRERELGNKREYDAFHRRQNRARWQRRNEERKAAKAAWYRRSVERIAKDRRAKRDYVARFGRVPKGYIFSVADMAEALRTGVDPFASLRAAWRERAKRGAKQGAATRKRRRAEAALYAAWQERFGPDRTGGVIDYRLIRKSLRDGRDYLTEKREQYRERYSRESVDPRNEPPPPEPESPFTARDEASYTRFIKSRRLFEGACDLRWQEYFAFREANRCARLTANDLRYAGQYTACAVPTR